MTTPTSQQPSNTVKLFKPPSAVVYSKDFEPISHIPMNNELYSYFMKYEIVRFPVQEALSLENIHEPADLIPHEPKYAEISAMKVHSADGIRLILIARTEETVLLMRNTFLPGQTKELNFIKTQAFYQGMIKAIQKMKKQQ